MKLPAISSSKTLRLLAALAFLAAAAFIMRPASPVADDYGAARLHEDHDAGSPMTDEAMARWIREFYEVNPIVRPAAAVVGVPADTFNAYSSKFDSDGNVNGTPVDTARIQVGESILWRRIIGGHTVTSGSSSTDPNVGALFDVPLDPTSPTFIYTFNTAGTFEFFCRPHEVFTMRGVVVVEATVGVTPFPGDGRIGFSHGPSPNPAVAGASFRFGIPVAGRASARVVDVRGRLVAELLDEQLAAGSYGVRWDGNDRLGRRAEPGVYFVQLSLPGHRDARRLVVSR